MSRIEWTDALELGVPAMDKAHRAFVDEIAAVSAASDADFPARIATLIASAERDFAEEEAVMENIDFPVLKSHREQHARVLSGLHHTVSKVMAGDITAGRHALDLLFDWLQVHVKTMDLALAVIADPSLATRHGIDAKLTEYTAVESRRNTGH